MIETIKKDLTKEQKMILIEKFHEMYYNTDQDTEEFAKEFYNVVDLIIQGYVPIQLEFLEDFKDEILELVKEMTTGA